MSELAQPGALLFARYAYPPNALGLCGADAPGVLLEYGDANESDRGLAELARTFEGAWPYLTLIAGVNGIDDPLDPRVVEAYWVGNELLGRVDRSALARHVEDRFRGRIGRSSERLLETVHAGTVPHHNFHVFAVYPWFGLLRTGIVEEPLHVLESCRITPAVVESTAGDNARVRLRPLNWDGTSLELGGWEQREVRWRETGRAFAVPVPGDWVSVHWDFVCDRLTPAAALALDRATRQAMRAVNASSAAAAALA